MTESTTHDRENLIKELQGVAARLDKKLVSRKDFIREAGISEWHVLKHFDSWNDLVRAAGLQPTDVSRIPDDEVMEAMYEAFMEYTY